MTIALPHYCRLLPAVLVVLCAESAVTSGATEPEYRVTLRHTSAEFVYSGKALQVTRDGTSLLFSKSREVSSFELLLGPELTGDFEAEFELEIASHEAMNIPDQGGTPVPYWGFRSTDGRFENYLFTRTSDTGWKQMHVVLRRTGDQFAAEFGGRPDDNHMRPSKAPGYFLFLMNDISQLRILSGRIVDATTGSTTVFGKAALQVDVAGDEPGGQLRDTQRPCETRYASRPCRCRQSGGCRGVFRTRSR